MKKLEAEAWRPQVGKERLPPEVNMYDFYMEYLAKFGEILTDMEQVGIKVDTKVPHPNRV